jgi:hypothetical protein
MREGSRSANLDAQDTLMIVVPVEVHGASENLLSTVEIAQSTRKSNSSRSHVAALMTAFTSSGESPSGGYQCF